MIVADERAGRTSMPSRFDFMFDRRRFPLPVDAMFRSGGNPTIVFLDATEEEPDDGQLAEWHSLAWNFGLAPLLWVATQSRLLLFNSYAPPAVAPAQVRIAEFDLTQEGVYERITTVCGRLAFDTGSFWRSSFARKINRKERVDSVLLRELATLEELLRGSEFSPLLAQKLIGRTIFLQYLVDRGLLTSDRLVRLFGLPELSDLMRVPESANLLFDWMRATFNGDLFPPDIKHERDLVGLPQLSVLADFLDGLEPSTRQFRLFPFRFDVIPVELISSIYEQFAHSVAGRDAAAQGLHYTPINLVDLALDQVFATLSPRAVILDPACGSGVFLVEAMRRLVFLRSQTETPSRELVRDVLYNQIHGVDINPGALQVTAFSLYLAALELDPEICADDLEWLL
jgi:hypothetical protein